MTAVSHWQRNPKSQNSEDMEAIKAPHFAYSSIQQPEHERNVTKNCSHHQTDHDKIILFQLNKSSPQSTPALPGKPSSLKASVSSITDYSHRQAEIANRATGGCVWSDKNTSWCLTAGKDNSSNTEYLNSNLYTFRNFYTPLQKGRFWLLWHYINFCHFHKLWCVTLWLLCVILCN